MSQPNAVQATIIEQVRDQLGGVLRIADGKGGVRVLHVPVCGVTFMLDSDPTAILLSIRKTRAVKIAYDAGRDLYDVTITDFARGGFSINAEREHSGVYGDTLGELVKSPRLRKAA